MTLEEKKLLYHARKENGLCVKCGLMDERTKRGLTMCRLCSQIEKAYAKKYSQSKKGKSAHKKATKSYYNKRKSLGLCVRCGKPVDVSNSRNTYCSSCVEKIQKDRTKTKEDIALAQLLGYVYENKRSGYGN